MLVGFKCLETHFPGVTRPFGTNSGAEQRDRRVSRCSWPSESLLCPILMLGKLRLMEVTE